MRIYSLGLAAGAQTRSGKPTTSAWRPSRQWLAAAAIILALLVIFSAGWRYIGHERELTAAQETAAPLGGSESRRLAHVAFVNMIVDHLTDRGVMEPRLLCESPVRPARIKLAAALNCLRRCGAGASALRASWPAGNIRG